jgi:hypothetical protein
MGRDQPSRAGLAELPPGAESAQISLTGQFDGPGDERFLRVVAALASVIGVSSETFAVSHVSHEEVELDVPLRALQRLRYLLQSNDARLRMLKTARIGLELGFGRREEWVLHEGRYVIRPPQPTPRRPPQPVRLHLFQPFLIAALAGCVAYAAAGLARVFWPDVRPLFLTLAPMLAAVESGYSNQLMRHRRLFTDEVIKFRAVELVLLMLLIKAGTYVGQSPAAILEDIRAWPHDPQAILDSETLVAIVLSLIAWRTTTVVMNDLRRLGEPPEKSRYYISPLDSLSSRFFWGGGLLLLLIGLNSIGRIMPGLSDRSAWTLLARLRQSTSPDMVLVLLGYYLLGLILLGQVRLALLRKYWQAQSLEVDETLGRRWLNASLGLAAVALLVAFLLPTGHTMGFLRAVSAVLAWISQAAAYLGSLLIFLFGLLLSPLLALLFGRSGGPPPATTAPRFEPPVASPPPAGPPPEWLLRMRTVLFWGLVAMAVTYVVTTYLRDHPELLAWMGSWRPLALLRRLWTVFRRLWGHWQRGIQRRLPTLDRSAPSRTSGPLRPFRFLRLSSLSPRERILYYYWSILKRAERWGLSRRPAQTPHEYRVSLEPHLPDAGAEMGELTEAFIEARYSQHPVYAAGAQSVKDDWQKVKRSLRTAEQHPPPANEPRNDEE